MADFKIRFSGAENCAHQEKQIASKLNQIQEEIQNVLNRLNIHSSSAAEIKRTLNINMQSVENQAEKVRILSNTLRDVSNLYRNTENRILNQTEAQGIAKAIKEIHTRLREELPPLGLEAAGYYAADPVNLCNGNFIYDKRLLFIDGIIPFQVSVFYNAKDRESRSLGRGWMHNYERKLSSMGEQVFVENTDGSMMIFTRDQQGDYINISGRQGTLQEDEEGFFLIEKLGTRYRFSKEGILLYLDDQRGHRLSFFYNDFGRLDRAENYVGEYLQYSYDQEGKLQKIQDYTGRCIQFVVEEGSLRCIIDPCGSETEYTYNQQRLSGIIGADGTVILKNEYDKDDRIIRQEFPDQGVITFEYLDEENRVIMTDQMGNPVSCVRDHLYRNTANHYEDGTEFYTYNERNQKTSFTDKNGGKYEFFYNDQGMLEELKNAENVSMYFRWGPAGQVTETGINDQWLFRSSYDSEGYQTQMKTVLGDKTEFVYDQEGNLIEYIHEDGSRAVMTYDSTGNVIQITHPMGAFTKYEYDALHRVSKTTDGQGNSTVYTYDNNDRILSVTDALGQTRTFTYDIMGNMIHSRDFDGHENSITYNEVQKPVVVEDKNGNKIYLKYDKNWNVIERTDQEGGITKYTYDKLNRIDSVTDPIGNTNRVTYDACGNVIRRVDGNGNVYQIEYDKMNRPIAVTEPGGMRTEASYGVAGNVEEIRFADGTREQYEFDLLGRTTAKTDRTGYRRAFHYNSMGHMERIEDERGCLERYEYYPGGLLKAIRRSDGSFLEYEYDQAQNVIRTVNQDGGCWNYTYDALNRVIKAENSGGITESYEYDALGNIISVTNGQGHKVRYEYSALCTLTGVIDAAGNKTVYEYDKAGRLISFLQGDKRRTVYKRDGAGNIIFSRDASGRTMEFQYDGCGNMVGTVDGNKKVTRYFYNPNGTDKEVLFHDGRRISFGYNDVKELTKVEDWTGVTRFQRDTGGRISQMENPSGQLLKLFWSGRGECTAMEYPDGTKVNYGYNEASQLVSCSTGTEEAAYEYLGNGSLGKKTFGDGFSQEFQYDSMGVLTGLLHKQGEEIIRQYAYEYDKNGQKVKITRTGIGFGEAAGVYEYGYTPQGALEFVRKDGQLLEEYGYDAWGNRIWHAKDAAAVRYNYNDNNQLISRKTEEHEYTYCYDEQGHLTDEYCDGVLQNKYTFSSFNRLEKAETPECKVMYEYNGLGMRVGERVQNKNEEEERRIAYISNPCKSYHNLLMRSEGEEEETYIWDHGLLQSTVNMKEKTGYFYDDLLTPFAAMPMGQEMGISGSAFGYSDGNGIFGFAGFQREQVSHLLYAQQREYDPEIGRFLSPDPVAGFQQYPTTLNPYAYCVNNPLNYVDYTGTMVAWLAVGIVGAATNVITKIIAENIASTITGQDQRSSFWEYASDAAGGFVEGMAAAIIGPVAAGTVIGAIKGGVEMIRSAMEGKTLGWEDVLSAGISAGFGAIKGAIFGKISDLFPKIPGITSGRGSFAAVWKAMITKASKGIIKNITGKTMMKGIIAGVLGDAFVEGIKKAVSSVADYLEDLLLKGIQKIVGKIYTLFAWVTFGTGVYPMCFV